MGGEIKILNKVAREVFTKTITSEGGEGMSHEVSGKKTFQSEETVSAKALRQRHDWWADK